MVAVNSNNNVLAETKSPIELILSNIDAELKGLDEAISEMQKRTNFVCTNTIKEDGIPVSPQTGSPLLNHLEDILMRIKICKTITISNLERLQI